MTGGGLTEGALINVVGLGYVGLPTALMLAANGVRVCGTDTNADLVGRLSGGENTIDEDGFDALFAEARAGGIRFSTDCVPADVYIIAVPTPFVEETRKVDASYILSAVKGAIDACEGSCVIVIESTISPGTIRRQIAPFVEKQAGPGGKAVKLAHAPERILPGNMVYELVNNPRVIGADDADTGRMLEELYSSFCKGVITVTGVAAAEMIKVVENTFRDVNIAYANELMKICNEFGTDVDVHEVIRIANMHPRVNILSPGPGVGGHCIPVDPWFLVGDFPDTAKLILSARTENDSMPEYVHSRILHVMEREGIDDIAKVGLYGLTYKENVNDVRESPTIALIKIFEAAGSVPASYDPHVKSVIASGQTLDGREFFKGTELVVLMVYHRELLEDTQALAGKAILDTRGKLDKCKRCRTYYL